MNSFTDNAFVNKSAVDILDQLQACLFVTTTDLQILYCNATAEELVRLSSRQIIGMSLKDLFLDGDLSPEALSEALGSANVYCFSV